MRLWTKPKPAAPSPVALEDRTLFLGLGPTKTGTTWLYNYLHDHPQFCCSPLKELHFFSALHHSRAPRRFDERVVRKIAELAADPELIGSAEKQASLSHFTERLRMTGEPERYLAFFRERVREAHRAFGELSPSYCGLTREGFDYVRASHPRVRVLLTLRDPLDRVDAVIRHMAKHDRAISYDRFTDNGLAQRLRAHQFHYDEILDNIRAVFRPDEVRVQFFETMFNQDTMDEIADFIGIARRAGDFAVRLAHSPPASPRGEAHRARLIEHLAPIYDACRDRLGASIPPQWAM